MRISHDRLVRHRQGPVPHETSRQIVAARVLCILCMMYVHVSPGFRAADWGPAQPMFWIGTTLADVLGRTSVPALSVVSGFLIAAGAGRKGFPAFARDRFRTLCLPMLAWTWALAALTLAAARLLHHETETYRLFFGQGPATLVTQNLLFLHGHPADAPLAFLRDLFVASLIVRALLDLGPHWLRLALPVALALWLGPQFGGPGMAPLILRPSIPAFVIAGALLQRHRGHLAPPPALRWPARAFLALALLHHWTGLLAPLEAATPPALWTLAFRAGISLWMLDTALLVSQSRLLPLCQRFEPVVYLAYLSHQLLISTAWALIGPGIDGPAGALYPVFFLAAPVAVLLAAEAGARALDRGPGWLRVLMSGKPGRAPAPAPEPAVA